VAAASTAPLPPPPPPPPPRASGSGAGIGTAGGRQQHQLHHRHAAGASASGGGIGSSLRGSAASTTTGFRSSAASNASVGSGSYTSAQGSHSHYSSYGYNSSNQTISAAAFLGPPSPKRPSVAFSSTSSAAASADHHHHHSRQSSLSSEKQQHPGLVSRTCLYFLLPSVLALFCLVDSVLPLQTAMVSCLVLYGLDLGNAPRTAFLYALLWSVVVLGVVQGYACWLEPICNHPRGLAPIAQAVLAGVVWTAVAAAVSLSSVQWLSGSPATTAAAGSRHSHPQQQQPTATAKRLQAMLHGLIPPISAALGTSALMDNETSDDAKAIAAPHLFALLMAGSMLAMARASASAALPPPPAAAADDDSVASAASPGAPPVLSTRVARMHAAVLLLTPPGMHVVSSFGRMLGTLTLDDVYNLILAATVPVLLYQAVGSLQTVSYGGIISSKQATYPKLFPIGIVAILTLVSSIALQQRYLIGMSHSFAYRFFGTKPSVWLSTLYWFFGSASLLFSLALWGRTTIDADGTATALLGEYHEDAVQLGLAVCGMCIGKAFGLPWNFVPLPVLACLGLVLWMTTRMLRYLAIFLFVGHATGVVVFTYRFAGMNETISVANLARLSLMQFAFVVVFTSVLVGLVAGLAVRPLGGFGAQMLRKLDATGWLLIAYTLMLTALEVTLLKRTDTSSPLSEQTDESSLQETFLYHPSWAMFTSILLSGVASFLKRVNSISTRASATVTALAIGKGVSIYIDAHQSAAAPASSLDDEKAGFKVFLRSLVAALLALVMFAPRVFLEPVHVKTFSRRSSKSTGRRGSNIPTGSMRPALLYAFVFLPLALLVSVPYVLVPLAGVFADKFQDEYYSSSVMTSTSPLRWHLPELLGVSLALWGLACVSMLNYYLPDAGGEAWKKLSALAFLVGTGIFFAAPMLGMSSAAVAVKNPYAAMSSLGSQLIHRRRSRTGGWGLLAAAIATLLAISGPLELKERPVSSTGHRDKLLMFRTMMFSLLFGGGVAWFVVMSTMREADLIELVIVSIACLIIASMGTVVAVLGYFLALEEYDDVVLVARVWMVVLVIFLPFAWSSKMFVSQAMHLFGPGGWLSTYLAVSCLTSLAIAVSFRVRSTKNATTSSLGNMMCFLSWTCAIALLYGRFGVAGLDADFHVRTMLWVPASVMGTLLVSPILLALEGEVSSRRHSSVKKLATGPRSTASPVFGFHLTQLNRSNRWVPLFFGSVLVFLLASLFAILLRGSTGGSSAAKSHIDVHAKIFKVGDEDAYEMAPDLAELASKAIAQSHALAASARVAGSGFWTAKNIFGPLLHLGGVFATLPSLYLLLKRSWYGYIVPTAQVTLVLPLNAIPLLLCRGLPSLQAAAIMGVTGGVIQAMIMRRADQESMMRI